MTGDDQSLKVSPRRSKAGLSPLALAGPAASVLFAASLIGFAAMRTDGYTHGTKAVSELGATGAPLAAAFNMLALILPGLLIAALALVLYRAIQPARAGPILLALSGAALAVAGLFPVDMADQSSLSSRLHLAGAMLSGFFWALSLFWTAPRLSARPGFGLFAKLTPWFALFLAANILWQILWQTTGAFLPGWGQRIGFAGYFLWTAVLGLKLALGARTSRVAAQENSR